MEINKEEEEGEEREERERGRRLLEEVWGTLNLMEFFVSLGKDCRSFD